MAKKVYYTKDKRPPKQYEKVDNESLVDASYHIPMAARVRQLMVAGEQLEAIRRERYDFFEEKDQEAIELPISVTRSRGADVTDYTAELKVELNKRIQERLEEVRKEREENERGKGNTGNKVDLENNPVDKEKTPEFPEEEEVGKAHS